ncbi:MAG: hypothetical protein JJT76_19635 [Clostridiaceae bacterium]|nr:hypothetical protein [Clostridiaceae bacterium]
MWIGLIILFATMIIVETYRSIKRERREKQAVYLDLRGKFLKSEIINKPYMTLYGFGRLAGGMENKFILVYHINDINDGIFKVNVAQSDIYDKVACIQTLNEGDKVHIRLKKYQDEDLYTFIENLSTSI